MNFINVTQGHEDSIGLEVFIKSFLSLDSKKQFRIRLFCFKATLEKHLKVMNLNYEYSKQEVIIANSYLKTVFLDNTSDQSESFISLIEAEKATGSGDVLLTLPTTKQSLKGYTGHTDYFRKKYSDRTPVMLFKSNDYFLALLTEHIKLDQIENSITNELINNKINILSENPYFKFSNFIFSGINPHCGEDGILGDSDEKLRERIKTLSKLKPSLHFSGPISGDTMFLDCHPQLKTCLVFSGHDQGLAPFKAISGLQAVNITLGLPFLRLSPDHGTAFNLYGKDKASYLGTLYTLKLALSNLGLT